MALSRIVTVFDSVCTELQCRGPPSLFHSDNTVEVPALASFGLSAIAGALCFCKLGRLLLVSPDETGLGFLNMELNQAQLLVHDDATLNKFKIDHDIPEDIQIERLEPNKDSNLVEGNGDRIPILPSACCRSTPFLKGNYCLHLRNPRQPQTRLVTDNSNKDMFLNEFVWVFGKWEFQAGDDDFNELCKRRSKDCRATIQDVNNRQASRKVADLLVYESVYRHVIPHKAEKLGSGAELNEEAPLARVRGWEEVVTLSSSTFVSLDSSNSEEEEEEGEEAISQLMLKRRRNRVVPAAEPEVPVGPISISSLDNGALR
ncbi:hypothetical protein Acr_05g0015680 [Actinidia rufa]|uniref:Uncharacterized protein n=1 Tax=Actinidia rufa TaxID=165716 RepID=A0A7J0EPJ4_9ERIC|nr:hypothetical protein Acr_05g0015680 [Actinidia rufa]